MTVPADRVGVHETHCCARHWCKYGDEDCPVMNGAVEGIPTEACEWCDHERETATGLQTEILLAELVRREAIERTPVTTSFDMKGEQQRIVRERYVSPWVVILDTTVDAPR